MNDSDVLKAFRELGRDLHTVEQITDALPGLTSYNDGDCSKVRGALCRLEARNLTRFNGSYWELTFPILRTKEEIELGFPSNVPYSTVERHSEQLRRNHSQTVERLADRGGLGVEELYCAAEKLSLSWVGKLKYSQDELLEWLIAGFSG